MNSPNLYMPGVCLRKSTIWLELASSHKIHNYIIQKMNSTNLYMPGVCLHKSTIWMELASSHKIYKKWIHQIYICDPVKVQSWNHSKNWEKKATLNTHPLTSPKRTPKSNLLSNYGHFGMLLNVFRKKISPKLFFTKQNGGPFRNLHIEKRMPHTIHTFQ